MKILKEICLLALLVTLGGEVSYAQSSTTQSEGDSAEVVESNESAESKESKESAEEERRRAENPSKFELRRVDREENKTKFIFKGETIFGTTASFYELSGDNADFILLLNNITAEFSMTTVKPYAAYFYRDNRAAGVRFGYSKLGGTIDSATLDLGDTNDVEIDVPYISLTSKTYSYAIFHRSYASLDRKGTFGLFADVELEYATGKSHYGYKLDGEVKSTHSNNQYLSMSFNPGIAVFVMHNVSASLSFELGGIHYTHISQFNDSGELIGTRDASKMRFMFNVLAINFGINFHIW